MKAKVNTSISLGAQKEAVVDRFIDRLVSAMTESGSFSFTTRYPDESRGVLVRISFTGEAYDQISTDNASDAMDAIFKCEYIALDCVKTFRWQYAPTVEDNFSRTVRVTSKLPVDENTLRSQIATALEEYRWQAADKTDTFK